MAPDLLPLADHLAAFSFIDGSPTRLHRLPSEVRSLPLTDIRRVARRYFGPSAVRMVIVTKQDPS